MASFGRLSQGFLTTARGPDRAREAISSDPRSHSVNNEKLLCL